MSAQEAIRGVLDRLSDAQVEALAAACHARDAPGHALGQATAGATPSGHPSGVLVSG